MGSNKVVKLILVLLAEAREEVLKVGVVVKKHSRMW
jgi:hypothetical protein